MDKILRNAWHTIYEGNAPDHPRVVAEFLATHKDLLFMVYQVVLAPITARRLQEELPRASPSAAS